jgi:hypothetical protein
MQTRFVLDNVLNAFQKEIEKWGLVCDKSDYKQRKEEKRKKERSIQTLKTDNITSPTHTGVCKDEDKQVVECNDKDKDFQTCTNKTTL